MNKADYKFHRNAREQIKEDEKQDKPPFYFETHGNPIYMPKRKKFKRK